MCNTGKLAAEGSARHSLAIAPAEKASNYRSHHPSLLPDAWYSRIEGLSPGHASHARTLYLNE